jgi:transcriptional regulator with XRE-family HTH domain
MMAKMMTEEPGAFGKRLAQLRKDAGFTQQELADEIGATRRMIAYYETESDYPPTNMLAGLASTLQASTDQLLGLTPRKTNTKTKQPDSRLLRRMQQIEKLSAPKKRQVMQVIDTFIENEQLKAK